MIIFHFGTEDLLRTRFAISPLFEITVSLWALLDPGGRGSVHLPWIHEVRTAVERLDLDELRAIVVGGDYVPDFISPPPETPLPDVHAELERVRNTPPGQVRRELEWRGHPSRNPRATARRLADAMEAYWHVALEPYWARIRAALEDDISHRATALTTTGALGLFENLHPDVSWSGTALSVHRSHDSDVPLDGRGLQLVPSVFVWPLVTAMIDPPWQPALLYPPRGIGLLWEPGRRDPEALAGVVGRGKARVLAALDAELSTTQLAERLAVGAAGVSEHLGALRRAGLVRPRREGRQVLYARTAAGDALVRAPS